MNNYHIYEEIGRGKFSVVYKGRKKKSIEYVAVKSLEKSRRKKVLNEVKIFHNLNHPNILKFHNWYETRNHLWIIFEYCSGGDLLQLIEQDKALPESIVKFFGRDLVIGLQYLHSNGIIYCDLKPSNVLLNEYGNLKLCDFGLARRIVDLIQPDTSGTDASSLSKKGTPYYMAPELFHDDGVHSYASDLWSLGCVLFELATGHPPFVSSSFTELVNLILNTETPRVDKFSSAFNDLLGVLLQKDPIKRISWENLRNHPFWNPFDIPTLLIPGQPHFENFLKSRDKNIQPLSQNKEENKLMTTMQNFSSGSQNASTKNLAGSNSATQLKKNPNGNQDVKTTMKPDQQNDKQKNVNIVRLSQNVMKNIIRESMNLYQEQMTEADQAKNDVKLHRDQEIDLGDGADDEDDNVGEAKDNEIGSEEGNNFGSTEDDNQLEQGQQLKMEFNKQKGNQKPVSNNLYTNTKQNARNLKPEIDEMNSTAKTGRGGLASRGNDGDKSPVNNTNANLNQPTLSHQRSNSSNLGAAQNQGKSKLVPIEQLLQHNSDTSVKPITGNKEIEKPQELSYSKEALAFQSYTLEEVVEGIDTSQIENHLAEIYNFLAGPATMNDKLHALNYFETIILNSAVANRLVNSAFMNLLLKLLKNVKIPQPKIRLCSIVGQLIRHATVIENELSQLGIPTILTEVMRDKSEKVRRKAIAALGEYLFYGATQMDEETTNSVWEISSSTVSLLARIIKSTTEEETVKFYACKTIENITAQSISAGTKFANVELLSVFISLYLSTKNEYLKICNAVCISHLVRLNGALSVPFVEKVTMKHIAQVFMESNPRIQQAFITILNQYILTAGSKSTPILNEEKSFFSSLIGLLEHSSIVIRGKCLLTFCLLFKVNLKWLAILQENKFITFIDRLSRDNYKYIQCCLLNLIESIAEIIPTILKNIVEELNKLATQSNTQMVADSPSLKESSKSFLNFLPIILSALNSQTIKARIIVTSDFLPTITSIFDNIEKSKNSKTDEYRSMIFMLFESFLAAPKLLFSQHEVVLQSLFPSLLDKLSSDNPDTKFNSLKIFTDISILFLNEESIYEAGSGKPSVQLIDETISNKLLPNAKSILTDEEPLPQYGLKLFSLLFDKNIEFVGKIHKLKNLDVFLDSFQAGHPTLTSYTVKLVSRILESNEITIEDLQECDFVSKLYGVFQNHLNNEQEWGFDDLVDITFYTLNKIFIHFNTTHLFVETPDSIATSAAFLTDNDAKKFLDTLGDPLIGLIDILINIIVQFEPALSERCATCLLHILYFYGFFKRTKISVPPNSIVVLVNTLTVPQTPIFTRKVSKILYWISIIQENHLKVPPEKRSSLIAILDKFKNSEDKFTAGTIREILKSI